MAEIQWTFVVTLGEKSIHISAKSVHKWLRKDVCYATFGGKIQQPKLKGRALMMNSFQTVQIFGPVSTCGFQDAGLGATGSLLLLPSNELR